MGGWEWQDASKHLGVKELQVTRQTLTRNTILICDDPVVLYTNIKHFSTPPLDYKQGAWLQLREGKLERQKKNTRMFLVGLVSTQFLGDANSACNQNVLCAVTERILKKTKFETKLQVLLLLIRSNQDIMEKLKDKLGDYKIINPDVWLSHFTPAKQRKYGPYLYSEFDESVVGEYTVHVKVELVVVYDDIDGEYKAPRAISEAHAKVVANTGPYIYTLSKRVALVYNNHYKFCYCSGLNSLEVGDWLRFAINKIKEKWQVKDLIFIENDFSQFDSSVHKRWTTWENKIIQYLLPLGDSKEHDTFRKYLKGQGVTKGHSKDRTINYGVDGTRKSGDNNTSIGNSLINLNMQLFAYKGTKFCVIFLGDDSLTLMSKKELDIDKSKHIFNQLGFDAKIKVSDNIFNVEFCSSTFWPLKNGSYILLPKFGRFLVKHGVTFSIVGYNNPCGYLKELACAYRHLINFPFFGTLIKYYLKNTYYATATNVLSEEFKYKIAPPNMEVEIDYQKFNLFFYNRYGYNYEMVLEELQNTLDQLGPRPHHCLIYGPLIEHVIRVDNGLASSSK